MRKANKAAPSAPATKRAPKAGKPVAIVSTPVPVAAPAVPAAAEARNARLAVIAGHRATVAATYSAPSLSVRSSVRGGKLSRYLEKLATPGHRADTASTRDESLLRLIGSNADKSGAFDPVALNADLGVISRLGSLGFIAATGDSIHLTATGAERARLLLKKA